MKKNWLVALAICCFRILYPFSADVCVRARFSFTVFLLSTYIEPTVFFRLSSCLPSCASCCIFISISICRFGSNHSISALVFGHSVRLRSSIALYRRIMFFCYFLFLFFIFVRLESPPVCWKTGLLKFSLWKTKSFLPFCSVVPLELMVCVLEFLGYVLGFGLISVESWELPPPFCFSPISYWIFTFQNLMSASCCVLDGYVMSLPSVFAHLLLDFHISEFYVCQLLSSGRLGQLSAVIWDL